MQQSLNPQSKKTFHAFRLFRGQKWSVNPSLLSRHFAPFAVKNEVPTSVHSLFTILNSPFKRSAPSTPEKS